MSRFARTALFIGFLVVLGLGFARLRFDADVLALLPQELPSVAGLRLQQEHFSNASELVVTVRSGDAETTAGAVTALSERFRALSEVALVVERPPWRDAEASAELIAGAWLNQPPSEFRAMIESLSPPAASATLAAARERLTTTFSAMELARLSYDPLDLTRVFGESGATEFPDADSLFASEDGRYRILFVRPASMHGGYIDTQAWLKSMRGAVGEFESSTGWNGTIRFTGGPAFQSEISAGMESDLRGSAFGTFLIVGGLIWLVHRRVRPVLQILSLLALAVVITLGLAGLIVGELNLITVGFAAILMGLGADYGLVLFHESATDATSRSAVRRRAGAGVVWSAVTTAIAFALIAFAGLPGLAQLGLLVALGVMIAAGLMLAWFPVGDAAAEPSETEATPNIADRFSRWAAFALTAVVGAMAIAVLMIDHPRPDWTSDALRPARSEAYDALEEMKRELKRPEEPLWIILRAGSAAAARTLMADVENSLGSLRASGSELSWQLPGALWPEPSARALNLAEAHRALGDFEATLQAGRDAGFENSALAMASRVVNAWNATRSGASGELPRHPLARWSVDQVVAETEQGVIGVGAVWISDNDPSVVGDVRNVVRLAGAVPAAWSLLGGELMRSVMGRVLVLTAVLFVAVFIALWFTYRRLREVLLSLGAVALAMLFLQAVMVLAGWDWNLMNLLALPLMLGVGIDYAIHLQLALRREGSVGAVQRTVGRALMLCAATTVVGFASLGFSSNAGLASLGRVCAMGVGCMAVVAIGLLPWWWKALCGGRASADASVAKPSALYREFYWKIGLWIARLLPRRVLQAACVCGVRGFRLLNRDRFEVIVANLSPIVGEDRGRAEEAARANFDEFALKLADLWRSEAGLDIAPLLTVKSGKSGSRLRAARSAGRGVLAVTPHLGNWEFGASLLLREGLKLTVLTLEEPGAGFTALRQSARERHGVRTHVVGGDPFAFIEIIRRLQDGEVVALLVDRPPAASAVRVSLFGKPIDASIAVADLARASGAMIMPVTVIRQGAGYVAETLGPIDYDRAALASREPRIAFTQEILRAFEPSIRQHPEQWFHFVPIWSR